jgi:hypothetical protein
MTTKACGRRGMEKLCKIGKFFVQEKEYGKAIEDYNKTFFVKSRWWIYKQV